MEEIVTVNGKQFKLTTDRPLTALERQQTIEQIQKQTGCSSCGPRTLSSGFSNIQSMLTCFGGTKSSGDSVTLTAAPSGAVGPYYVRFFRKSAPGSYSELGSVRTVSEGGNTSTTIALVDTDLTGAVGDSTAGTPTTGATGAITDPQNSSATFGAGVLRVATTTYDSCPTGAMSCVEYCDVSLACVAPTCNFVVT